MGHTGCLLCPTAGVVPTAGATRQGDCPCGDMTAVRWHGAALPPPRCFGPGQKVPLPHWLARTVTKIYEDSGVLIHRSCRQQGDERKHH